MAVSSDIVFILSQIKTIEAQLSALKSQVAKLSSQANNPTHTFADLYGRFPELSDVSTEEIDAALYQASDEAEEMG